MNKYLLTGSKGMLATELQAIANEYCIEYIPMDRIDADITRPHSLTAFVSRNRNIISGVQGIVHCAAYTDVPGAEKDQKEVVNTNIIGTRNVADMGHNLGARIIYISTDYVYPGDTGNYKEDDLTRPVNFYALTKLAGEVYAYGEQDLVIRTSFKPSKWIHARAFNDLYTSADYVDVISKKISFLICEKARGIYNVGTERKSIYDLARRRSPHVAPMSRDEITGVYLPKDISMNIGKFNDLYNRVEE